ncbi:MAG: nucleotide exchange factor GrpE [Candidatus Coatesbacteria bacterium]|nr:nucleotide exchange factor GrpE [Candidatus Coatesbacteria bacterium]
MNMVIMMQDEEIQDNCEEHECCDDKSCSCRSRTSIYKDELKELKEHATKTEEYLDDLRRLKAEFDNFRKRSIKEKEALIHYGEEELVMELLTTIDNFERAIAAAKEAGSEGPFLEGMTLVHDQMMSVLKKRGLERIKSKGEEFDPNIHEAVLQEFSDEVPPNHVIDELQTGYMFRDKLMRPAKVRVAKAAH